MEKQRGITKEESAGRHNESEGREKGRQEKSEEIGNTASRVLPWFTDT